MNTKLLYLEHMQEHACEATVVDVQVDVTDCPKTRSSTSEVVKRGSITWDYIPTNAEVELLSRVFGQSGEDGVPIVVVLDQTVFYPQGGGQPYNTGTITSEEKMFNVTEVRFVDGLVRHIGTFVGEPFVVGDKVVCSVDIERRKLNTRLHSAGHLIDMALKRMGIEWVAKKGYHFPDGPYVEYAVSLEGVSIEDLRTKLETTANTIISQALSTEVRFVPKSEMGALCGYVPDYIPDDKPGRVVLYGNFGIPCGGTHVANLADIGKLTVRKIKQQGDGTVRVAYAVEQG